MLLINLFCFKKHKTYFIYGYQISQSTGQYPEPMIGSTGYPLSIILHSCSCNRRAASSNTSSNGRSSSCKGDQRTSAAALARGQRRGIILIELTNSPHKQTS